MPNLWITVNSNLSIITFSVHATNAIHDVDQISGGVISFSDGFRCSTVVNILTSLLFLQLLLLQFIGFFTESEHASIKTLSVLCSSMFVLTYSTLESSLVSTKDTEALVLI